MKKDRIYSIIALCYLVRKGFEMIRKINAVFALLTTVLLLDHAIFFSIWMLSRCSIEKNSEVFPQILTAVMVVHAILSIILMISNLKGAKNEKHKAYYKLNIETYVQRIAGILIIFLIGLHIAGAANHFQPKMLHAILHPLFFATVLAHVSVSVGRAFVTLGVGNARAIGIINVAIKVLCCTIFVAGVVGFYICLFVGVAK